MSVTFSIVGSPTRTVTHPATEYDDEFTYTEDVWPTSQMSNGNAFSYIGILADKCAGNDESFPSFDYVGTWTPAQAELIRIELVEHIHMLNHGLHPQDVWRYMNFNAVLAVAIATNNNINWS